MITDGAIEVTDPTPETAPKAGLAGRLFGPLIRDMRDITFVRHALWMTLVLGTFAATLFIPGAFSWWLLPVYLGVYLFYLGPFVLMLHNTSHRMLFKKKYDILNRYIPWVVSPLFGMPPETYYVHHIGMHHVEGNLPDDLSSTMKYQRDSFVDFLKYFGSFMAGYYDIHKYFASRGRWTWVKRFWIGELSYFGVTAGLLWLNWRAALVVLVIPVFVTRFLLMAGNWAQHAFVDPEDSTNDYRTVITFINSPYNHRCFNDGYHLGHHLKANRHWLDMPADFLEKKEEMIRQKSLVFDKLDYFMVFLLLVLGRYRTLASHAVQLDDKNPMSEDEIVALMHRRLRRFEAHELAPLRDAVAGA